MKVVVDTSILRQDLSLAKPSTRVFFDAARQGQFALHVPRVVIDELLNKVEEEMREARDQVESGLHKARRLTPGGLANPLTNDVLNERHAAFDNLLMNRLAQANAAIIDYPTTPHAALVERALKRRRPFDSKGRVGYRDALIWESVVALAADGEQVCLVTANTGDFCWPDGSLHQDLLEDLPDEPTDLVVVSTSLEDFSDEFIKPQLEVSDLAEQYVTATPLLETALRDAIEETLSVSLQYEEIADDIGLDNLFETPRIQAIYSVDNLYIAEAHNLEHDGRQLLRVEADARVLFEVFIFKSDYFLVEDQDVRISDPDWNRHYMSGSVSKRTELVVEAIIEPDTTVSAIELERLYVTGPIT